MKITNQNTSNISILLLSQHKFLPFYPAQSNIFSLTRAIRYRLCLRFLFHLTLHVNSLCRVQPISLSTCLWLALLTWKRFTNLLFMLIEKIIYDNFRLNFEFLLSTCLDVQMFLLMHTRCCLEHSHTDNILIISVFENKFKYAWWKWNAYYPTSLG